MCLRFVLKTVVVFHCRFSVFSVHAWNGKYIIVCHFTISLFVSMVRVYPGTRSFLFAKFYCTFSIFSGPLHFIIGHDLSLLLFIEI